MTAERPLIELKNVTARVRDQWLLPETCWKIEIGSNWAVIGPNGAGKSTLAGILAGHVPTVKGTTIRNCLPEHIGFISFELHDRLMRREEALDEGRHFSANLTETTTARDIILSAPQAADADGPAPEKFAKLTRQMGIRQLLPKSIRALSSGETRKVLLARAMIGNPRLLILDEPYEGLDSAASASLAQTIENLMQTGVAIVLITHQLDRISERFTRILCVKSGRVVDQGPRSRILAPENIARLYDIGQPVSPHLPDTGSAAGSRFRGRELIRLENATIAYGKQVIFDRFSWTFRRGENWALTGPNGSGKSTLVKVITGDHPQAYANRVFLFGRARGSGESIWDIKNRIGLVSAELQTRYQKKIPVISAIRSGFFDSVGLYRSCSPDEKRTADRWLEIIGMTAKRTRCLMQLSYGERRLALLARAMVKSPTLLVLDEPCQGLDPAHRKKILALIEQIGSRADTNLLYISHRPIEIGACITHTLSLGPVVTGQPLRPLIPPPKTGAPDGAPYVSETR